MKIYSIFDTAYVLSQCHDLNVCGLQIGYDFLSDQVIDFVVDKVAEDTMVCCCEDGGTILQPSKLVSRPIVMPPIAEWQRTGFGYSYEAKFARSLNYDFKRKLEEKFVFDFSLSK